MIEQLDISKWQVAEALAEVTRQWSAEGNGISSEDFFSVLERPKDSKLGDYACPCFRFAKGLGKKPHELASLIKADLDKQANSLFDSADCAGPFLNLKLSVAKFAAGLLGDIASGQYFDRPKKIGQDEKPVMIEYSQPNTHKAVHVGHIRNVALGDSLGRVFKYCGYTTVMANYIGDEGAHIAKCIWYIRRSNQSVPEGANKGEWLGEMYTDANTALEQAEGELREELNQEVSQVLKEIESKKGEIFEYWRQSRQWSIDEFESIYDWIYAHFDHWFSESEVSEESQTIVDEFRDKDVFIEDDGAIGIDLKDDKLGFVILRKRDGNTLYATKDLALARRKYEDFNIGKSIYVVASEQNLHFKQVFKTLEKMGFEQSADCFHLSYGMVTAPDGKMSSRKGNQISFRQLQQVIGEKMQEKLAKYQEDWSQDELASTLQDLSVGAVRYGMVSSDPAKDIVFAIDEWTSFEGNSGPYLMYAYARSQSILKKGLELGHSPDISLTEEFGEADERELLRYLNDYNNAVVQACESSRISTIAHHLFDMSKVYSRYLANVSVLKASTPEKIAARLALVQCFATVLKSGLFLLGMNPPQRM